jgi:hypothetical protein
MQSEKQRLGSGSPVLDWLTRLDGRWPVDGAQILDDILEALRNQLNRYQGMASEEKQHWGGETHCTCAYLEGAVVATRRAVKLVERLKQSNSSTN